MFSVDTFDDDVSYASSAETAALIIISTKKNIKALEIDSHPLIDEALEIKFGNKRIYKNTAGEANECIIAAHDSIARKSNRKKPSLNKFEEKFMDNYEDASRNGSRWSLDRQLNYLREQQQLLRMSEVFYAEKIKESRE